MVGWLAEAQAKLRWALALLRQNYKLRIMLADCDNVCGTVQALPDYELVSGEALSTSYTALPLRRRKRSR